MQQTDESRAVSAVMAFLGSASSTPVTGDDGVHQRHGELWALLAGMPTLSHSSWG